MTNCYFCKGAVTPKRVTIEDRWGEELAVVEDVPALVCENCGEIYLPLDTAKQLDRLRQTRPRAKRTMQVPVYAFATGN